MYYVYHIPKVKIGMTKDLGSRVFEEQGYDPTIVEILYASRDMKACSDKEKEMQLIFGFRPDQQTYADLIARQKPKKKKKTMKAVNLTSMTTTFPCSAKDISSYLYENPELTWKLHSGETVTVNKTLAEWINKNIKVSQYNGATYSKGRSFVYNEAMLNFLKGDLNEVKVKYEYVSPTECSKCIFTDIRNWAEERGIYDKGDVKTQYVKLQEEAGEVARAIIKKDSAELQDGIGDMVVVLTNLAHLAGLSIEDCIKSAYDVINKRKGSMINGSFVKNETL